MQTWIPSETRRLNACHSNLATSRNNWATEHFDLLQEGDGHQGAYNIGLNTMRGYYGTINAKTTTILHC